MSGYELPPDVADRLAAHHRSAMQDYAHARAAARRQAADRLLIRDLLAEVDHRLDTDPVLRYRANLAGQVLNARDVARGGGDSTRADTRAAAVGIVVAERAALPGQDPDRAPEALAQVLWARLGEPSAHTSWRQLLERGQAGPLATYRQLARTLIADLDRAGWTFPTSGAEETP